MSGFIHQRVVPVSANEIDPPQINNIIEVPEEDYKEVFSYMDILEVYYKDIVSYCEASEVQIANDLTLEVFHDSYYEQDMYLIIDYVNYLKSIITEKTENSYLTVSDLCINPGVMLLSSGEKAWWEDINPNDPLPEMPNYNNWLYDLRVGDIIYEEGLDVLGMESGHIGIVEKKETGIYQSEPVDYWRVIESVNPQEGFKGVVYSVVDNNRFVKNKTIVLRVREANSGQCEDAVEFCQMQIGKKYDKTLTYLLKKENSDVWMCSTLVWAAYKSTGIDICSETQYALPIDIYNSSATYLVSFIPYNYLTFEIVGKHPYLIFYASWDVKIKNSNSFDVIGLYNSRMCNDTHALKFDETNLHDETEMKVSKNNELLVYIEHNGAATHITACYRITLSNTRYKVVSAANNLSYANGQGHCTMYYSLIIENGESL